jgi:hypothetical protein
MAAPVELQKARLATCKTCPEFSMVHTCNKCGCLMPIKVMLTGAKCPLDKWPTPISTEC